MWLTNASHKLNGWDEGRVRVWYQKPLFGPPDNLPDFLSSTQVPGQEKKKSMISYSDWGAYYSNIWGVADIDQKRLRAILLDGDKTIFSVLVRYVKPRLCAVAYLLHELYNITSRFLFNHLSTPANMHFRVLSSLILFFTFSFFASIHASPVRSLVCCVFS